MGAYLELDELTRGRVDTVLADSFVGDLRPKSRRELLGTANLRRVRAGYPIVSGRGGLGGLTISGVLRVFDPDDDDDIGLTHRNLASGEPLGLGALLDLDDDIWIMAMTPAEVLSLDLRVVADLREADPSFHRAIVRELFSRYRDLSREYRIVKRGSVRQRVVRELLDRAASYPGPLPIVVQVTNEALAHSIGARREVVNRQLNELARLGLLALGRGRITIQDLIALRTELGRPRGAGRSV